MLLLRVRACCWVVVVGGEEGEMGGETEVEWAEVDVSCEEGLEVGVRRVVAAVEDWVGVSLVVVVAFCVVEVEA